MSAPCVRCQHVNPPGHKFCSDCGAPLPIACPSCGASVVAGEKFCGQCGSALSGSSQTKFISPQQYTPSHLAKRILESKSDMEGERKQVTVLFADLKGSMELLADRDPEEARALLEPMLDRMMEAVHHYDGTVNQVMGDGIMALFGAPLAQEDHAVRACYAALRMQERVRRYAGQVFASHGVPMEIRVGLNSGAVVVGGIGSDLRMEYTAVGQTTHLAARMEQMALPGTALISTHTLALAEGFIQVRSKGLVPIKGMTEPVEVFELLGAGQARSRLQAGAAARGLSAFVGRDAEMAQLHHALEKAHGAQGNIVAVVGEPGVGKSRLFHEFVHSHRVEGWKALESGSVSYGKATSYLPVIDLLKSYFRIHDIDGHREIREKIAGKLLVLDESLNVFVNAFLSLLDVPIDDPEWTRADPHLRRQRTLEACKRLLVRESLVQPLVLVFEDLHWTDSESQTFLNILTDSLPSTRILLLVNFRPEFTHTWGTKSYYTQLRIDPLPPASAEVLLEALLGSDAALRPLKALLIERTQGNPLYLEESVRSLVESGALAGSRGGYSLKHASQPIEVPATVQAILAARIDRLSAEHKRLLQAAAVVGKNVPFGLLESVAELPDEALRAGLEALRTAEFLYEASLFPDLEYTFKHALTHEVAYGTVLNERKKALHGVILEAIESRYAERLQEQVEAMAHHAMRAERWEQAHAYYRQAGEKASGRSANREAVAAYEEALNALASLPETPGRIRRDIDLRVMTEIPMVATGDARGLLKLMQGAQELVVKIDDPARACQVEAYLCEGYSQTRNIELALEHGTRAVDAAEKLGSTKLTVQANLMLAIAQTHSGRFREGLISARRSTEVARPKIIPVDSRSVAQTHAPAQVYATYSYVWGCAYQCICLSELGEFDGAIIHGEEGLRVSERLNMAYAHAGALAFLASAHERRGDREQSKVLNDRCARIMEGFDITNMGKRVYVTDARVAIFAGQHELALSILDNARALYASWEDRTWVPLLFTQRAEALCQLGRSDEAIQCARQVIHMCLDTGELGQRFVGHYQLGRVLRHFATSPEAVAEARTELQKGLNGARSLGMRPLEAECLMELAQIPGGPIEHRRTTLATAKMMFEQMGMLHVVDLVQV